MRLRRGLQDMDFSDLLNKAVLGTGVSLSSGQRCMDLIVSRRATLFFSTRGPDFLHLDYSDRANEQRLKQMT